MNSGTHRTGLPVWSWHGSWSGALMENWNKTGKWWKPGTDGFYLRKICSVSKTSTEVERYEAQYVCDHLRWLIDQLPYDWNSCGNGTITICKWSDLKPRRCLEERRLEKVRGKESGENGRRRGKREATGQGTSADGKRWGLSRNRGRDGPGRALWRLPYAHQKRAMREEMPSFMAVFIFMMNLARVIGLGKGDRNGWQWSVTDKVGFGVQLKAKRTEIQENIIENYFRWNYIESNEMVSRTSHSGVNLRGEVEDAFQLAFMRILVFPPIYKNFNFVFST